MFKRHRFVVLENAAGSRQDSCRWQPEQRRGHKAEKETSYLEDFDPYARSWQGSQYGSR